jgi:hypothetical protein
MPEAISRPQANRARAFTRTYPLTAHWKCMAYSTPSSLRKRSVRDALDRPLAVSRGLEAALAARTTLRIHTPHKNKTLEAYPILPRPRGLHQWGARSCAPPGKRHPKTSRVPGNNLTENPAQTNSTHNRRIASEGVYLLLHRLGGYTPGKNQPKKQAKAPTTNWPKPRKEHNPRAASEGVYLLSHRLEGYCRVPQLGVPKLW